MKTKLTDVEHFCSYNGLNKIEVFELIINLTEDDRRQMLSMLEKEKGNNTTEQKQG